MDHSKNSGGVFFVSLEKQDAEQPEDVLQWFESSHFGHSDNAQSVQECLVVVTYHLEQPWDTQGVRLEACYFLRKKEGQFALNSFSVSSKDTLSLCAPPSLTQITRTNKKTITADFVSEFYTACQKLFQKDEAQKIKLAANQMFFFEPVRIPKPWGQEIWFTGVEKRGVSKVRAPQAQAGVPLPWLVSALPKRLLGEAFAQKNLVLVKILDPLSDSVKGDLYYELHNEKNEVYVVTRIAPGAGQIKMGVNPNVRARLKNDEEFKKEFLRSIQTYEKVRRQIDDRLDRNLSIPPELEAEEQKQRAHMDSFTGFLNLKVGDVVRVPIHVPHALQHGVQVVEFQTPTYERFIISFAQKVLTQNHWDTEAAFRVMKLVEPAHEPLDVLQESQDFKVERVCSFQEFSAERVSLESGAEFALAAKPFYRILYMIEGVCEAEQSVHSKLRLEVGSCFCIPAKTKWVLQSKTNSVFLMCFPH